MNDAAGRVGHLGFALADRIVVLPLNYVTHGGDVLLCLGTGTALDALRAEPQVAFEVEQVDSVPQATPTAWSVLIQGTACLVREPVDLGEATALGLTPLVPEPGRVYVRVRTEKISGRKFNLGALARFALRGADRDDPATCQQPYDV